MSFYPCRVGGDGKSPLNKEFQVAGCVFVGNVDTPQVITITIADVDFIVIVSFLKSSAIGNAFALSGTNQCVCTLGKVGDAVIVDGIANFMDKKLTSGRKGLFTWESSKTLKLEKVEGSSALNGGAAIFYCKYI